MFKSQLMGKYHHLFYKAQKLEHKSFRWIFFLVSGLLFLAATVKNTTMSLPGKLYFDGKLGGEL